MTPNPTRRRFIQTSAAAVTALSASKIQGANERIRAGFIGVGNRGGQLLDATLPNTDVEVVALCDVFQPYLDEWKEKVGGATTHREFREIIDRKDIDVVFIGTPDHWHAIQTLDACEAGKDVYVEKPLSFTIVEGRKMVEAARRNDRIVQVGIHRRSSKSYQEAVEFVQNDGIGKVTVGRCYRLSNMWPAGIGKAPDSEPPATLDWDLWVGPRPYRPYNENIAPYKFRWHKDYSSQMGNWGVHYLDGLRWLTGEEAPVSVSAHGGQWAIDDDRTIPDTMHVVFEFASGRLFLFGQYEACGNKMWDGSDLEARGTKGTLHINDRGFRVAPERGGQFQERDPKMEPIDRKVEDGDVTANHVRNFLDCVKSRDLPNCDVEIGHRSTAFCHLANIALETKSRIEWDAANEKIVGNEAANARLHYEYREPWKLV